MTRSIPATSRAAHGALDPGREGSLYERIVDALIDEPTSAARLAGRLMEPYHDVERRCSALKRRGVLRFGPRVRNPSGRQANTLVVTPEGEAWRETGAWPEPPATRAELEGALRIAARAAVRAWERGGDPGAMRKLARALRALDAHDDRPRRAAGPPQAGTARTRFLAREGFHVRGDGSPVAVDRMATTYLENADRKLMESGVGVDEPERVVLRDELGRRGA